MPMPRVYMCSSHYSISITITITCTAGIYTFVLCRLALCLCDETPMSGQIQPPRARARARPYIVGLRIFVLGLGRCWFVWKNLFPSPLAPPRLRSPRLAYPPHAVAIGIVRNEEKYRRWHPGFHPPLQITWPWMPWPCSGKWRRACPKS